MQDFITGVIQDLKFSELDYFVIALNSLMLISSRVIITYTSRTRRPETIKNRVFGLQMINIALLLTYIIAGVFSLPVAQEISKTGLTILIAYVANFFIQNWIVHRFGTVRNIQGEDKTVRSYTSEVIGLVALLLVVSLGIITILNIFQLDNWLKTSSFIGAILFIVFACKDYFLNDLISGLTMHYNSSVHPGSVIRVRELNILGVIKSISLSETVIRDLVQGHDVTIANSKLRSSVVETFSADNAAVCDYIDFNIGYEHSREQVEQAFTKVWEKLSELENTISIDKPPKIRVIDNSDHAVIWRVSYFVNTPYKIIEVRNLLQTIAFEECPKYKIQLNTPLTHTILSKTD